MPSALVSITGFTSMLLNGNIFGVFGEKTNLLLFFPTRKFHVQFADEETQIQLAELLRVRAMATNPMDCEGMDYEIDVTDFPSEKETANSEWTMLLLEELEDLLRNLGTPRVTRGRKSSFNNISLGTYRWLRGCQYVEHLRQFEVLQSQVKLLSYP